MPKSPAEKPPASPPGRAEARSLAELSPAQWKSGVAAWLGWLFDGLDMHLYTLVAAPFVAELLGVTSTLDPKVGYYSSWIQAAFLIGWALGGSFFGVIGDRLGRSRALVLTILTYAAFTGVSFFAQTWWQLLIFRFIAALGIGGEWAVGASLLSETWPRRWRPWMAAVLQTGVNLGILLATLAVYLLSAYPHRTVFLVGVIPALLVLWIRRAVPETEEWRAARAQKASEAVRSLARQPGFLDLFRGKVRRTTLLTLAVCALSLSAHWAITFWYLQHLRNLEDVLTWSKIEQDRLVTIAMAVMMITSIAGNFLAAAIARRLGYRPAIVLLCLGYTAAITGAYIVPRGHQELLVWLGFAGVCQGLFALFTMYMPPLFPTLLRTTGAGFCYNFGRIAAALGTVIFGLFTKVGDYRLALLGAGFLFLPAAAIACFLREPPTEPIPE
jgi:MFS family permease